jgi:hypothetical protein
VVANERGDDIEAVGRTLVATRSQNSLKSSFSKGGSTQGEYAATTGGTVVVIPNNPAKKASIPERLGRNLRSFSISLSPNPHSMPLHTSHLLC